MPKPVSGKVSRARRKLLAGAGAAAAGAVSYGLPMNARGQSGPIAMRLQSAWAVKDILYGYALEFAKTVNDMTGGDLKLDMLPANAIVPPSGLLEAVSKGALDGAHCAISDHYARNNAFALWGSGPAFGMDANMLLAWHKQGGGRELLDKLYALIGAGVVSFPYAPQYTPPLGWFKKPVTKWEDFNGLKYRAAGVSIEMFAAMGADVIEVPRGEIVAALADGRLDAAEFNNPSSDRALGLPDASKVCMLQSYHRNAEPLEILFNRIRYNALPAKLRAIIAGAVDAASQNSMWEAIDRNSQDLAEMLAQDKVHAYKTPNSVLLKQLECFDEVLRKKSADNSLFKEILESQKKFAERAVKWEQEVVVNRRLAYDHFFNRPTPPAPKKS
jgi:TRAP-type mannitol/chloroaromatic compound transport system substrate-binding protein